MGLLNLPRELRDEILSYILIKPQNTITMLSNSYCYRSEVSASQPAVSKVSKQLRAETLPVFYNSNVFLAELSDPDDLRTAKSWLSAIGASNVEHLRHLVLSGWTKVDHYAGGRQGWLYRYVRVVFDLREGEIVLENDHGVESPTPTVMWHIDGLKHSFREMTEAKKGERFTASEVEELMEEFHDFCASG